MMMNMVSTIIVMMAMVIKMDISIMMMMTMMTMITQQIPTMTKTHHGGNLSVMNMVGICRWQNPTIDNDNDDG